MREGRGRLRAENRELSRGLSSGGSDTQSAVDALQIDVAAGDEEPGEARTALVKAVLHGAHLVSSKVFDGPHAGRAELRLTIGSGSTGCQAVSEVRRTDDD